MKNEFTNRENDSTQWEIEEPFMCNCVDCDKHRHKLFKNRGRTKRLLEDGTWSEEVPCDVYKMYCSIDKQFKGIIFTPYEDLEPDFCPLHPELSKANNLGNNSGTEKSKHNFLKKIFNYFSKLKF